MHCEEDDRVSRIRERSSCPQKREHAERSRQRAHYRREVTTTLRLCDGVHQTVTSRPDCVASRSMTIEIREWSREQRTWR